MRAGSRTIGDGGYFSVEKGAVVAFDGKPCKVRRVISFDTVILEYLDTKETVRAHPDQLRDVRLLESAPGPKGIAPRGEADHSEAVAGKGNSRDLEEITEEDWKEANRRFALIEPLLSNPQRTRADVEAVATAEGVAVVTIYKWIRRYREAGYVSGLILNPRGRRKGTRLLSPEQEAAIDEVISKYLDPQAITPADVIEDVKSLCEDRGIPRPHPNTIRNRIADIPLKRRMSMRGESEKSKQRFEERAGTFPEGEYPLQCVQIDHVRLNIKVVDAVTRQTIETRPWLTLAIDCYSRMIVGYFLSLLAPSAFGTGVCLYMGMMPKRDLLQKLDLPGRWPVHGRLRKVHADNAKEFKGSMLAVACTEHRIDLQLRPRKRPHYGAYIERMVGNVNRLLHKKLGTTHSSPTDSPDYDSSATAVFTLAELEVEIVDWIVNSYHVNKHSGINTTPLARWEKGLLGDARSPGIGMPQLPSNPEKMRLDFMPFEERIVHPYGVEIDRRLYYDEVLRSFINEPDSNTTNKKRKFIFRYDPRSIRRIWFWNPRVKQYFEIPLKDMTWPDISWSEFAEYLKQMDKQGIEAIDEASIRGFIQRSRARQQEALAKTRVARGIDAKSAPKAAVKSRENTAAGSDHYAATPPRTTGNPGLLKVDTEDVEPIPIFDDIDI